MVVLRSGRELKTGGSSSSSSSVASKRPKQVSHSTLSMGPKGPRWKYIKNRADDPAMPYEIEALKFYNQNSCENYKLVEPGCITPVWMGDYFLNHLDFEAKNNHVPHAPTEMFFTEITTPNSQDVLSVRLCVSLGPVNSISGDIVIGCYYCRADNSIHHPKGGGFVRGGDELYKTVEDICGMNLNNAILDEEKHLPMLQQVSQDRESKKESEYTSEQVDDATPYATEAMTFLNQKTHRSYKLVEPGFVTRVILPTCLLFHVNFTAKETDVDVAPKLFFAELTSTSEVLSCKRCVLV